jgi:MYXO-CTERM domain-containing protein
VTEYAQLVPEGLEYYQSYDPVTGEAHSLMDDYQVVLRGLPRPYLTRLTADLPATALTEDLNLQASLGADLGNFIQVTRDTNRAPDIECADVCTDPYGSGGTFGTGWRDGGRGDGLCAASPGRAAGSTGGIVLLLGVGLALVLRRRGRASREV